MRGSTLLAVVCSGALLSVAPSWGQELLPLPKRDPFLVLVSKVERLDGEGHFALARKLLGEAAGETATFAEGERLARFWLESDERFACELAELMDAKGVDHGVKARDALDGQRALQDRFDREFKKKWYSIRPVRNASFALAERRWRSGQIDEWLKESEAAVGPDGRKEALEAVRLRHDALKGSQADLERLCVTLLKRAGTRAEETHAQALLREAEQTRKACASERTRWLSYGYVSPYLGNASLWCWKASAVDDRRADKQSSLRKAFTAAEVAAPLVPEATEDVRAQFGLLREELRKAVDKKDPGFERDLEKLEHVLRMVPLIGGR